MLFTGKITEVSLHELDPDTVTISGGVGDRFCSVEIKSMGIGEILIGRFGLKRDEITIRISAGGDQ